MVRLWRVFHNVLSRESSAEAPCGVPPYGCRPEAPVPRLAFRAAVSPISHSFPTCGEAPIPSSSAVSKGRFRHLGLSRAVLDRHLAVALVDVTRVHPTAAGQRLTVTRCCTPRACPRVLVAPMRLAPQGLRPVSPRAKRACAPAGSQTGRGPGEPRIQPDRRSIVGAVVFPASARPVNVSPRAGTTKSLEIGGRLDPGAAQGPGGARWGCNARLGARLPIRSTRLARGGGLC
jgi:hypothetical protein